MSSFKNFSIHYAHKAVGKSWWVRLILIKIILTLLRFLFAVIGTSSPVLTWMVILYSFRLTKPNISRYSISGRNISKLQKPYSLCRIPLELSIKEFFEYRHYIKLLSTTRPLAHGFLIKTGNLALTYTKFYNYVLIRRGQELCEQKKFIIYEIFVNLSLDVG